MGRALLPGLVAALGFGLAFAAIHPLGPFPLFTAGFFLALGSWRKSPPFLWLSALFLGYGLWPPKTPPTTGALQLPLLQECEGIVVDLPEPTGKKLSFTVEIPSLGLCLLAYGPKELSVYPGQRVRLLGKYDVPEPEGYREYLARRGIHGLFWADWVEIIAGRAKGLLFWIAKTREKLRTLLSRLPERTGALLSALLMGSRGLLSGEEKEAFRKAGVAHLLALSGLHVGILVAGGWFLLGLLRLPRAWRYVVLLPLVVLYVFIGGLRVSLLRAAAMFGVLGVFWILWERGFVARPWFDSLQGLSLAALLVLLIWPWSVMDAAFQLSFSAAAGIVLLLPSWTVSPYRKRLRGWFLWSWDLLAATACAQIGVLPFLGSTFGYLTPYGLLANLLLVPWTTLLLWAGILTLPLLSIPQAQAIATFLSLLAEPYLWLVEILGNLPGAMFFVDRNFGLWCLFALFAFLILRAAQEDLWPGLIPHRAWPG